MKNIELSETGDTVVIIDQTLLPNSEKTVALKTAVEMYEAIASLKVRGAPAIGIFAGYALYVLSCSIEETDFTRFYGRLEEYAAYLGSSRPTAVNLSWALRRMLKTAQAAGGEAIPQIREALYRESCKIQAEDAAMCRAIAENGLSLIEDGCGILTHCNAGPLATSQYGTALGPIILGTEKGMSFRVYADETRPLLQGARLTAYELDKAGVDVTLICDNMAATVMKKGWVQACFVGCDRIAANGDTANKIGTAGAAILAKHFGIPFYVLGPSSTVDMSCVSGDCIEIELRDPEEIRTKFYKEPMAPAGVKCYNPAFDVTDHELITAVITEKGIIKPPYDKNFAALFAAEK